MHIFKMVGYSCGCIGHAFGCYVRFKEIYMDGRFNCYFDMIFWAQPKRLYACNLLELMAHGT